MKGQHLQVTYLRHFLEHDPPNFDHGHRLILDLEPVAGSRAQLFVVDHQNPCPQSLFHSRTQASSSRGVGSSLTSFPAISMAIQATQITLGDNYSMGQNLTSTSAITFLRVRVSVSEHF